MASDEAVVERLRQALSRAAILRQETGSVWVSDLRRLLAILDTRAPSDAALVEALERLVVNYGEPHPLARAHLETEDLRFARAALAAAKGQQP